MLLTILASSNRSALNTSSDVFNYLNPFLHWISTAQGIVCLALGAGVAYYGLYGRRGVHLLLFLASLTGMVGFFVSKYHNNTLIPALEAFRNLCRPIYVLMVGLLTVRLIIHYNTLRWTAARASAMAFMALQFAFSLRLILVAPERSFGTIVLDLMLLYGVWELLRRSITSGRDVIEYIMVLLGAGAAFYLLCIVQLTLGDLHHIVFTGRFCGIAQNPQFTGETTAILIICANFVVISGYSARWQKIFALCCACGMLPFMLWTGSRTSMGICAVGLLILYRVSIRRWAVFAVVGAVAYELYTQYFHRGARAVEHLVSTNNDRYAEWAKGLAVFSAHPILGQAAAQTLVECSFIVIVAALGSVGIVLLVTLIAAVAREIIHVFRYRDVLDPELRKMAEFACAITIAQAAGMTFDAYLVAAATTQAIISWMSLSLLAVAWDAVEARRHGFVPAAVAPANPTVDGNAVLPSTS